MKKIIFILVVPFLFPNSIIAQFTAKEKSKINAEIQNRTKSYIKSMIKFNYDIKIKNIEKSGLYKVEDEIKLLFINNKLELLKLYNDLESPEVGTFINGDVYFSNLMNSEKIEIGYSKKSRASMEPYRFNQDIVISEIDEIVNNITKAGLQVSDSNVYYVNAYLNRDFTRKMIVPGAEPIKRKDNVVLVWRFEEIRERNGNLKLNKNDFKIVGTIPYEPYNKKPGAIKGFAAIDTDVKAPTGKGKGTKPKSIQKDTVIVVYCSPPSDLNSEATYTAANQQITVINTDRFKLETILLMYENSNTAKIQETVEILSKRGKNNRVLFHLFGHGQNTGGKLPALKIGGELIDIEKIVLGPLRSSNLDFALVLVDACNEISTEEESGNNRYNPDGASNNKNLTSNNYAKMISDRQTLRETKMERKYKKEPLGLFLSAKGWLAIATAAPDQKAWAPKDGGGKGSAHFFDLLATEEEEDDAHKKNWVAFLESYKQVLEAGGERRSQTPVWIGKINEKNLNSEDTPKLRKLSDEAASGLLRSRYNNLDLNEAKKEAGKTAERFCELIDNYGEGAIQVPAQLAEICIKPDRFPIFNDLSIAMREPGGTNYVKLTDYRSSRRKWGNYRSLYIKDSLRLKDVFEDTVRQVIFVSFTASKIVSRPRETIGTDTVFMQKIYVEVHPDPNLGQKFLNLFRKDKPRFVVHRVMNVSRVDPPPPPPDSTIKDTPGPKLQLPKDYYLENANTLIASFYDLIRSAASSYKDTNYADGILENAKKLFKNAENDSIQFSSTTKPGVLSSSANDYFSEFWTKFEGKYKYDSVYYSFENPKLIKQQNGEYLIEVSPDKWMGMIEFDQEFAGFTKARRVYPPDYVSKGPDITTKLATVWLTRQPDSSGVGLEYELRLGSIEVKSTRRKR